MSVLLVASAGSAVALSVADDGGQAVERTTEVLKQGDNETGNETTNATVGNETGNATVGNETGNVTGMANVTFEQQVAENDTVTVQSVTVPEGGFVVIHTGDLLDNETVRSVIGVSGYLEPGTHGNVTVQLYANVTGANFTQDALNVSETLIAVPHRDTNGNQTFDFVATNGTEDVPYTVDNETVMDQAFVEAAVETGEADNVTNATNATLNVTANESANASAGNASNASVQYALQGNQTNATGNETGGNATNVTAGNATNVTGNETNVTVGNETNVTAAGNVTANASLTFENQTSNGSAVVVQRVMLSEGGFVEITNAKGFSIGNTTYLEPGVHTNVTVLLDNPLSGNQSLIAFALRDVNENQQFDGVATGNESEQPYVLANGSAVTDSAFVIVTGEVLEGPGNVTAGNVTNDSANVTNATADNVTNVTGNATNATADNATADNVTAGNATNVTGNATGANASVTFENQTSNGTTVTVQRVTLSEGGFVAVHQSLDGEAGIVIGTSGYLEPGTHRNVTVRIYANVTGANFTQSQLEQNATLIAMPHRDTNGNQSFDFVVNASLDSPYFATDREPITDSAFVTLSDGAGINVTANATMNATAGNATMDNATAGNVTGNATNATGNQSIAADLDGDHNETNATTGNATLELPEEQSGNGTTLNVTRASAGTDYYLEVRFNGTVYNTTTAFNASEEFSGALLLEPTLVNVSTVVFNVTLHEAGINGSILAQQNVTYTLVTANETDNATANATNVTGNATNVTAGNETNVTGNETNVTADNVTAGNATNVTGNATNVTGNETNATASVTFESQTSNGTVVVESATLPEGGFVAIHNVSLLEGERVRSVVGASGYLEPGTHENVTVELFENATFEGNVTLIAMPHLDSNGNQTFDFVATNGTVDPPYTVNGSAVIDNATVTFGATGNATVAAGNETAGNETAGNETEGNATDGNETDGGDGDDGGY